MKLLTYARDPEGLFVETSAGKLHIEFRTPSSVRIRYTKEAAFHNRPSLMVVERPKQHVPWTLSEQDSHVVVAAGKFSIRIDKATCAFTYRAADGTLLAQEPPRGGKTLEETDVYRTVFDGDPAQTQTRYGADGLRAEAQQTGQVFDRKAYRTKLEFVWQEGEALYGLGSHEEGMMNLRGKHQYLYQQNLKAVVPVLLSSHGYGILVDSYSYLNFRDDAFGSYLWTDTDDEMEFYWIYGPEFDQIVGEIRGLTGDAPMLPKWTYGYIQSKERYVSAEELLAVAGEYRSRKLPLDGIVLDWQSWTGSLWGQKSLDPERFPDPAGLAEALHAMNVKWMVSIWPNMSVGGDNHREMDENGFLLGNGSTYDAFDEEARRLYWKQSREGLFAQGVDAWWCDCTEPFEADWKGAVKPEPEERMRLNTAESKRYLDPEFINAYSLLHAKGIYEGQRGESEDKRVVNLTRSAYGGQHRYATITWSGDTSANWETLRSQIADGLNFCLTGSPYWTLDIGAFFVRNDPSLWFWNGDYAQGSKDLGYRELYVRWFQLGAFLPMFRAHGTDTPREIWQFGSSGEPVYDILAKYLKLRYTLMPYLYSHAGQIARRRYTLLRALVFDYRSDPLVHNIGDQFMFGSAFLVAPVTMPMYYGPDSMELRGIRKSRSVYLPRGEWYDYWNEERIEGGRTLEAAADLATLPLFVRAGSIVPTGSNQQYADDRTDSLVTLNVYPGTDASFILYEDAGDGYAYERGEFAEIELKWSESERQLTIGARVGRYEGVNDSRSFLVRIVGRSGSRTVDYTGDAVVIADQDRLLGTAGEERR
ncbi:TIM-barrel domain-containing protein [Saccharibacillus qingshengii]|uniref:glycoside hydrolase family 31 protein n=1 Tax=Saccharibacillus qingshengii TaxID=1763540 RepID=UPI001554D859|nr:TIM-barrel domain-containing protein [Saccharibacillus qingshengii]